MLRGSPSPENAAYPPPILEHFDPASPTLVTCDTSSIAIGALMSQLQSDMERPIAFASHALSPTEQRYSVGEQEALACFWACESWHMYLYGREFVLRTDHQALGHVRHRPQTTHIAPLGRPPTSVQFSGIVHTRKGQRSSRPAISLHHRTHTRVYSTRA